MLGQMARRTATRWEVLLVVLILVCGVWSWTLSPFFLQRANLLDLLTPYIFLGLLAFGLMFVLVIGEIDISGCSMMAASAAVFAWLVHGGTNVWLAAAAVLGVATLLGLVNGLLVGILNLPSLAVTLGTLATYRGLAYVILRGNVRTGFQPTFVQIGGGYISNELPISLLVFFGFAIGLGLLLQTTRFGRYLYTIGSNREAARYSGIAVTRMRVSVFVLSGLMAGFAAIIYLGFFDSVEADAASASELMAVITIVVLGGVSIFGGSGSVVGVLLSCVLVAEIRNGMQLASISSYVQDIVVGGLLITAIAVGNLTRAERTHALLQKTLGGFRKEVISAETHAQETHVPSRQ